MRTEELDGLIKQLRAARRSVPFDSSLVRLHLYEQATNDSLLAEEPGLLFLLSGRLDYRIGRDESLTLKPGEYLFFQEALAVHAEEGDNARGLLIPLNETIVREFLKLLLAGGGIAHIPERASLRYCLLQESWTEETGRLLGKLLNAYASGEPGSGFLIHLTVLELLYRLFPDEHRIAKLAYLLDAPTYPEPLRKAERFLLESYHQPVRIKQLTDAALISESQLTRLYKKHFGLSPMERLASIRMEQAALLLRDPSMTVMQTALQVGYQSLSAFVRQFRGKFGVSPKEYQLSLQPGSTS